MNYINNESPNNEFANESTNMLTRELSNLHNNERTNYSVQYYCNYLADMLINCSRFAGKIISCAKSKCSSVLLTEFFLSSRRKGRMSTLFTTCCHLPGRYAVFHDPGCLKHDRPCPFNWSCTHSTTGLDGNHPESCVHSFNTLNCQYGG